MITDIQERRRHFIVEKDVYVEGNLNRKDIRDISSMGNNVHVYWRPTKEGDELYLAPCFDVSRVFLQPNDVKNVIVTTPIGADCQVDLSQKTVKNNITITTPTNDTNRNVIVLLPENEKRRKLPAGDKLEYLNTARTIHICTIDGIKFEEGPASGHLNVSMSSSQNYLNCISQKFGVSVKIEPYSVREIAKLREATERQRQ